MTYDQYWYGDVRMARAFYQAEKLRQERRDADAWRIGSYVADAINSTVGNAMRQTGTTKASYPKYPRLTQDRMEREALKRQKTEEQEEKEALFADAYMKNMLRIGKQWGRKNAAPD